MKSGGDAGSVVEHFHNAKTEKISLKPIGFLFGDSFAPPPLFDAKKSQETTAIGERYLHPNGKDEDES